MLSAVKPETVPPDNTGVPAVRAKSRVLEPERPPLTTKLPPALVTVAAVAAVAAPVIVRSPAAEIDRVAPPKARVEGAVNAAVKLTVPVAAATHQSQKELVMRQQK